MASSLQFWDWLENRRGENDKVFREIWKVVETEVRKTVVAKRRRRRKEGKGGKKIRGKRTKKRIKEKEKTKKE